jgi:hypothetical protein
VNIILNGGRAMPETGKRGEKFDPETRMLKGHKFTDMSVMRTGIMQMCQGMGLGGDLSKLPVSQDGFLVFPQFLS